MWYKKKKEKKKEAGFDLIIPKKIWFQKLYLRN